MAAKPSKIRKLGTADAEFLRMGLIAPPGWGKTVFCGTAPKALFLTTDPEGTASAAAFHSTAEEWPITNWSELDEAYRWLDSGGTDEYDFVIVDNITEAQRLAMRKSMAISKKQARNPDALDDFVPQQADYQRSQQMILDMVTKMHDLPVHIIYTSHINDREDSDGEPYYTMAIHGQKGSLANQIQGYMKVVGMGESRGEAPNLKRRLWFSHSGPFRGKDRTHTLGAYRDDLDIPTMMKIIESGPKTAGAAKRPVKKAAAAKPAARRRTSVK